MGGRIDGQDIRIFRESSDFLKVCGERADRVWHRKYLPIRARRAANRSPHMPEFDLTPIVVIAVIGGPVLLAYVLGSGVSDE